MNTELTKVLWDIESHINEILASPHESAGDARLQGALEDAQDLQTKWSVHRALHMDFCLREAADKGALTHEGYQALIERLWAAMRAEPEPEGPGETQTPPKRRGALRAISHAVSRAVAKILRRAPIRPQYQYGDLHHAAEIIAGYHLDPVNNERERLVEWIHGNRLSHNRHAASEREIQMYSFLRRQGWSPADLRRLSDDATQGG